MLTGGGPGPNNNASMITAIVLVVCGAIMNANVIGTIANLF